VKYWSRIGQKVQSCLDLKKVLFMIAIKIQNYLQLSSFYRIIALSNWPFKPVCLRSRAEFSMAAYFKPKVGSRPTST